MSISLHCDRCGATAVANKKKDDTDRILAAFAKTAVLTFVAIAAQADAHDVVFTKDAMLCKQCREGLRRLVADYMTEKEPQ